MPRTPRYDPSRARFVASADGVTLYKTRSGNFFTEKQMLGGVFIAEISREEAQDFAFAHADPATYAICFDSRRPVKISVDIPPDLLDKIDACKTKQLKTRRAVILAALNQYTADK